MLGWDADFVNDPASDYDLVVEILHNNLDVGLIHKENNVLVLKWYASQDDVSVPLDWLAELINRVLLDYQ